MTYEPLEWWIVAAIAAWFVLVDGAVVAWLVFRLLARPRRDRRTP